MSLIRVWYPGPRDENLLAALADRVQSVADVSREGHAECEVLIDGRPTFDQLERIRKGGAVVVPFAGVPPATLEALRTRPDLTLHNLHHNGPETAETSLALLLSAAKRIPEADRELRKGDWTPRYTPDNTIRLEGQSVLVVGLGAIGSRVAGSCAAMGMKVSGIRRHVGEGATHEICFEGGSVSIPCFPPSAMTSLLPSTHILILAIPLTPETRDLIGREELGALAKPAILVNAARAQIVKEQDLYEALRDGVLHAAGLDVWYRYPKNPEGVVPQYFHMPEEAKSTYPSDFPFHELNNVVLSPHRGGSSHEAEMSRIEHLAELVRAYAANAEMPNLVSLEEGY